MIEKIYEKIIEISKKKYAFHFLILVAFLESFIFPIPPDLFLIILILANKSKAFTLALFCTISSVLGGILGYLIGSIFFDTIGTNIINYYHLEDKFEIFKSYYNEFGVWIVGAGGFTPIPYKLITIFSGFVKLDILQFTAISFISRGARFFLIALLLYFYGKKIETILIKRFGILTLIFFLLLILIYIILKYW